jgi:catechol 2,3-dioxygenase-like lactoylglutathione lyase family enzyme
MEAMIIGTSATKVVVRDIETAERFYTALGLKLVSRNLGGEGNVRQEQAWLSPSGDMATHVTILSRFVELPPPSRQDYPGEFWLTFNVSDVDATCRTAEAAGGGVFRAGQDRPEHSVRAAVIHDPDGHYIELVGPMIGG